MTVNELLRTQGHSAPANKYQRLQLRIGFAELELPTDYVTKLNFPIFEAAEVPLPREGKRFDDALLELTWSQADTLLRVLRREQAKISQQGRPAK